jgi:hypothetical protein
MKAPLAASAQKRNGRPQHAKAARVKADAIQPSSSVIPHQPRYGLSEAA